MTFFYLPDEVKYHRLPAKFLSLPREFECTRFTVSIAAVKEQRTSQFSDTEFVCTPGEVYILHSLYACSSSN